MTLFEVPIEVATTEEMKMRDELGAEPNWTISITTLNPELISMVYPGKDIDRCIVFTVPHETTVVLLSYGEFVEKWKEALE